jgi:hypothetical protein
MGRAPGCGHSRGRLQPLDGRERGWQKGHAVKTTGDGILIERRSGRCFRSSAVALKDGFGA